MAQNVTSLVFKGFHSKACACNLCLDRRKQSRRVQGDEMVDTRISNTFSVLVDWAREVGKLNGVDKLYIFGSLINDNARDFQMATSDLDLVLLMNESANDIGNRLKLVEACEEKVDELEGRLIKVLGRDSQHPHTSIVCLTPKEAYHGIHKSGDVNLLSEKQFVVIEKGIGLHSEHVQITMDLDEPGFYTEFADDLVAIQYAQEVRNNFLSNSYNEVHRGLLEHLGDDPLPKKMLRTAAILGWKELGEDRRRRTDLTVGVRYIQRALESVGPLGQELYRKIDGHLLGRGEKQSISRNETLMVAEILFDIAIGRIKSRREQLDGTIETIIGRQS